MKYLRIILLATLGLPAFLSFAQTTPSGYLQALKWRMIGPHRGGRTVGAAGVPQQPGTFYIGVNNGGVWKTTDYGRTWVPLFDQQSTGSIGDVAVAPSDPNIIYVGSGEGLQRPDLSVGNGIYKSTDAGKTWTRLGLSEGQQVGGLAIDPHDPNRVFVAMLGHPYGPNKERGVYRTTDGGKTWQQVLYKDENTGAIQVAIDPQHPNIVYADLWAGRQGPWENGAWNGPGSGLYKSADGGNTWSHLTKGLPTVEQGLGRIGFCIAPSNPNRMYATVDAGQYGGMYRSDDAGESWTSISNDGRYWGRGSDFAEVKADPKNADIVYTANVVVWRSADGGNTWKDFRGAPGGDDYHRIWIDPEHTNIMLIASDQGAIITVNGGETFSSWYNQPTAQFYHVSTDNAFPYNVYGGQQESGSVGIASRGNDGQVTFREWHPVGVEEYGYVAADPLNPDIIYGGKITKYNKRTGQVQNIAPEAVRSGKYRFLRTAPVLFSPIDPKTLFFAGNVLFKTNNGGHSWSAISPDLTRSTWDIPASVGIFTTDELKKMPRRGVIYTVAPSPKDSNAIWCGTDDGLIQLTRDGGKTWKNVTPTAIDSWSKISLMDAGHFDKGTAYAAVNRIRLDDMHPHIYKTNDNGVSWKEIVNGLPNDPINVVREDPYQKGLLFAGSETAVYVSFNDGEQWQPLRLNMPATSIRDLVIKDDDIVAGTHGRSFWILDNISSLRQLAAQKTTAAKTVLFRPQKAIRVRWNMNTDTPLPQEEPAGQNPPDGAIIDYFLEESASAVTLEIKDANGKSVRKFSNSDQPYALPAVNIPLYWIRPQESLGTAAGAHRFTWDLHYAPLPIPVSFPIAAIYGNTAPDPRSPWVMPGNYTVTLTVNGTSYVQPLQVKMDPRVTTSLKDLSDQHRYAMICYEGSRKAMEQVEKGKSAYTEVKNAFLSLLQQLEETDNPPTEQLIASVKRWQQKLQSLDFTKH
ncbi:glycoside hydrolase [Asinibacterium sp. OR53]|uniref:VPS10 domain-containing protein n=1 Tax=Asinibacterium sp. OR53 TaxID=925409 RepID=UPI0004AFF1CF|nr:glycoside hydrolase [Asinibacterium sp. OR53]